MTPPTDAAAIPEAAITDAAVPDAADPDLPRRYRDDGVALARGALAPRWLELLAAGMERAIATPGPFLRDHTPAGARGRYAFGYWQWPDVPEFGQFLREGPIAALAAHAMGAAQVSLIMDNWFLREGGAENGAPWHQDYGYFDFTGRLCAVWIPLEPVSARDGLAFLKGSHAWDMLFAPVNFSTHQPFDGVPDSYHPLPPTRPAEVLAFDMVPGDAVVFDLRTVHRVQAGHQPEGQTSRRLSLRFADQDARFQPRGPWTEETAAHLMAQGLVPGGAVDSPLTPILWRHPGASAGAQIG